MTDLIQATALTSFSRFVEGYGVVHGDPDNADERARFPLVPTTVADALIGEGVISLEVAEIAPTDAPPKPTPAVKAAKVKATARPTGKAATPTDAPPID